ncbi:MAG: hypothetical protein KatS3mg090_0222 [Patescibacteria group bacterium]|nr:MAG: hypothetical protein KatS3mg090_0222 [Patescibacteria group bacterium]
MQMPGGFQNNNNNSLDEIAAELEKLKSGIIAVSDTPSLDDLASACSLYLALMKKGLDVYLYSEKKIDSKIIGSDKFSQRFEVSGNNLEISFPYQEGSVNDVSAKIENGKFVIVLVPAEGSTPPDPKEVKFDRVGGSVDFIITVGVSNLRKLGSIYTEKKDLIDSAQIINLDRQFGNNYFGVLNFVATSFSSISEIVYQLISKLKVELDQDIATNLYIGLVSASNFFRSMNVKPETFEIASYLHKVGVKKDVANAVLNQLNTSGSSSVSAFSASGSGSNTGPRLDRLTSFGFPKNLGSTVVTQPTQPVVAENRGSGEIKTDQDKKTQPKAPEDWLKPKIFTSKDQ